MSVNKVTLIGRLGSDPDTKQAGDNTVTKFSLATNESWKDKSGVKQSRTEWHRITAWGKLGDLCKQYLAKGRQCYVEGKLETQKWEKDGQTHYTTQVIAQNVTFLGDGGGREHPPEQQGPTDRDAAAGGGEFF